MNFLFNEFACFAGIKGWILIIVFYLTTLGFGFAWGYLKAMKDKLAFCYFGEIKGG